MRVLFVVPPNISYAAYTDNVVNTSGRVIPDKDGVPRQVGDMQTDMPLGILSIAAYCRQYHPGAQFSLLDFNVILSKISVLDFSSFGELFEREILRHGESLGAPDIVGISALFSPLFDNVILLADLFRRICPDAAIIVGGGLATNQYRELFHATPNIDACCCGEGEIPMRELLASRDVQQTLREHPSWITPEKADSMTPVNSILDDLDEIPPLDYSFCDITGYNENSIATHLAIRSIDSSGHGVRPHLYALTSRGCPNLCCFCASHSVHGRKMRYHSVDRVKSDIRHYIDRYNPSCIVLQDDNFSSNRARAFELMEFFKTLSVKVVFTSGLSMANLDREFLRKLKEYGTNQILLPIESGCERVLREIMHKPLNRKIIRRVVKDCCEVGITAIANLIIGLPGETRADIEDSVAFAKTLDIDWFYVFAATPLPGSEMYDVCLENGYITREQAAESGFKRPIITTSDFSAEYIGKRVYAINLELNFLNNFAMRRREYDFALRQFSKVFKAKSDHAPCHFMCGVCHERLDRRDEAEKHYLSCRTILSRDPVQAEFFSGLLPQMRELFGGDAGAVQILAWAENRSE